ncbi:hypothetical protein R3P38DRAFT_2772353 [Favolaschia claudopus]|uniref:Uncharacterized protein n=1 Tax=Favolaschia claudopus TaxID=2862362 RepID=A0AAW0C3S3_9AGAR
MHPTFPRFEAVSLRIPGDPTAHAALVYSLPGPDRKTLAALYPADSPVSAQCWQNFQSPVGFIRYVNGVVEKIRLIPLHTVPERMTLPLSEFITSPSRITNIDFSRQMYSNFSPNMGEFQAETVNFTLKPGEHHSRDKCPLSHPHFTGFFGANFTGQRQEMSGFKIADIDL